MPRKRARWRGLSCDASVQRCLTRADDLLLVEVQASGGAGLPARLASPSRARAHGLPPPTRISPPHTTSTSVLDTAAIPKSLLSLRATGREISSAAAALRCPQIVLAARRPLQAANSRFVILSYSNELEYESSLSISTVKSPPFFFADRAPCASHISAFLTAIMFTVQHRSLSRAECTVPRASPGTHLDVYK
jgi:hypothetical protein